MYKILPLLLALLFLTACTSSDRNNKSNDYDPYSNDTTNKTPLPTSDETTFNDKEDVALNTLMKSNTITITSINSNESILVSLTVGELYVNESYVSAKKMLVKRDDKIRIEMLSANEYDTLTTATLTIGATTREFEVTTKILPLAYTTLYGSAQDDEVNSAYFKGNDEFALSGTTNGDLFQTNQGKQELISFDITALTTLSYILFQSKTQKSNTFRYDNVLNTPTDTGNVIAGDIGIGAFITDATTLRLDADDSLKFVHINALVVDKDNNIYIAGDTEAALLNQNHLGMRDAFLAKYNSILELQWVEQFGTAQDDSVKKILLKYDGNTLEEIITVGETDGAYSNTIPKGGRDIFVQTHFISGRVWVEHTFGTAMDDYVQDSIFDKGNNLILIRYTGFSSYIESYTWSGQRNYTQKISPDLYLSGFTSLYMTNNAIYAAGSTLSSGYNQTNKGSSDIVISKMDLSGNHLFTRIIGTPQRDEAVYIHATEEGVVSVIGNTKGTFNSTPNNGGKDIFYMKLAE